jgi:hypothetical protein
MYENDLTQAIVQILSLAYDAEFKFPLHVVMRSADGQGAAYVYPAEGENPKLLSELFHSGEPLMVLPYEYEVREWDEATENPRRRVLRVKVAAVESGDGERELGIVMGQRNTRELIEELDEESAKVKFVLLPVGFESTTVWVRPDDASRHRALNDAVEVGGTPMGLIFGDYANGQMRMWNRVFPEHIGRLEDAQEYLNRLSTEAAGLIKEMGTANDD